MNIANSRMSKSRSTGKSYPLDSEVEVLPSEGYLTGEETQTGEKNIKEQTNIRFTFPDGQEVVYHADNVILDDFTKEYIIEKKLFPYIPFYIARYEKEISEEKDTSQAIADLEYFRDEMMKLYEKNELTSEELIDLIGYVNTITG